MRKFATFLPTIFCKNSVKSTFSLKKSYTVNQFDEKILLWEEISEITTLWVCEQNLTNSSSNQLLSDFFIKCVAFTKFLQKNVRVKRAHCAQCGNFIIFPPFAKISVKSFSSFLLNAHYALQKDVFTTIGWPYWLVFLT